MLCIAGLLECSTIYQHDHTPHMSGQCTVDKSMQISKLSTCVHDMPSGLPVQA